VRLENEQSPEGGEGKREQERTQLDQSAEAKESAEQQRPRPRRAIGQLTRGEGRERQHEHEERIGESLATELDHERVERERHRPDDAPESCRQPSPEEVDDPDGEGSDNGVGASSCSQVNLGGHVSVANVPQVVIGKVPDPIWLQRPTVCKEAEAHQIRAPRRLAPSQEVIAPGDAPRGEHLLNVAPAVEPARLIRVERRGRDVGQILRQAHGDKERDEEQIALHETSWYRECRISPEASSYADTILPKVTVDGRCHPLLELAPDADDSH
jgi:hypothetical protein